MTVRLKRIVSDGAWRTFEPAWRGGVHDDVAKSARRADRQILWLRYEVGKDHAGTTRIGIAALGHFIV